MDYNPDFDAEGDWINAQMLLEDLYKGGEITHEERGKFYSRILWRGSALGLSMSHIFAQHGEMLPAQATFWTGAGLIQCKQERLQGRNSKGGGIRGKVQGFSKQSRLRLMKLVSAVRKDELPVFITLTYPGEFSNDPQEWKKNLKNFVARLGRKYKGRDLAVMWKLEPQKRGAPHFHLLVWGFAKVDLTTGWLNLLSWVSNAWYEVVGSADKKHLAAGTKVEKIRSRNGCMFYTSKYLAKIEDGIWEGLDIGRIWGVYFRQNLPMGHPQTVYLTTGEAKRLLRLIRKKMGLKGRSVVSLSLFSGADFWYERLPDIMYPAFRNSGLKQFMSRA